jgi:transcriptional regulator with XRE-family HTH domain
MKILSVVFYNQKVVFYNLKNYFMDIPNVKKNHIGRKIERIRELRGIKQETLASGLGITQQAVSKMEQSEKIDDEKLERVAELLGVNADTIKNFNEEAVFTNFSYDQSTVINYQNNQNPIDKIAELYEGLLASERQKNIQLEVLIKKYETLLKKYEGKK